MAGGGFRSAQGKELVFCEHGYILAVYKKFRKYLD
jgi:hypothetical protein